MFYLFHSPGEGPTVWLNVNNHRSPFPPLFDAVHTGAQHQQSQQEDGWFPQSSASSHVPHKQYPGLQRYHPDTVPVTVSTQVQPQKQPESLHHALSRGTGTVETFPRFVHLSVLLLVISTAVLVLCMWKNERQSGYQMLSFNAGCTHLLLLYFLCMHLPLLTPLPPRHPLAFLVCIMS